MQITGNMLTEHYWTLFTSVVRNTTSLGQAGATAINVIRAVYVPLVALGVFCRTERLTQNLSPFPFTTAGNLDRQLPR